MCARVFCAIAPQCNLYPPTPDRSPPRADVLAVPCRPIARALAAALPALPFWASIDWAEINAEIAAETAPSAPPVDLQMAVANSRCEDSS